MKHFYSLAIVCLAFVTSLNAQTVLEGFRYSDENTIKGKEWESPTELSLNKEQPRAYFFSFQKLENAEKVLPDNSQLYQSLNGKWAFHWAPDPDSRPVHFFETSYSTSSWDVIDVPSSWNMVGVQKDGSLKYGVPIYVNQPVIFQHSVKIDDWRGGVMRTPKESWTTYKHRNEVGSYKREFTIPENWNGKNVFVQFDGVDSFFYLWINGKYVGFSKNSRNAARFNIDKYLVKGTNTISVEVYRSSDGSFLESQDMFRLPGIFRTVALYAVPKLHFKDLVVTTDGKGVITVKSPIENLGYKGKNNYKVQYRVYENKLYSDDNFLVESQTEVDKNDASCSYITIKNAKSWSAEKPYRYTLVAELKDSKNRTLEYVSTYFGFVKVEIKDTPASEDEFGLAGRYFYVNGKTVKFKGVNRHETNPARGHAITHGQMEAEIMLMKRANINHVRCSHYPDDPYFLYLCDKYGIYIEDEANLESHEYYYGKESLSHVPEWKAAHVARVMEMVHSDVNHPSVVIWSLGNEAGPGKNFVEAYNAIKKFDTTRPVQYERNNAIVDMGSNQYPSIDWMRGAVTGKYNIKYPFHVSEYAHSMGNAVGNLVDYWKAIESTNFFCGGAIWDWIDQSMYNYDPKTGTRYLAYGGDFGDTPNDGQFVMNGIIFGDLEPKPQYYEVKKVYQHIDVKPLDIKTGNFEVFNKYYFQDLSDYDVKWSLYANGVKVQDGKLNLGDVAPRTKKSISIPYSINDFDKAKEYFVKVQFLLKKDEPWAAKGYVQAEEQVKLQSSAEMCSTNETVTFVDAWTKPEIALVANSDNSISIGNVDKENPNIKTIEGQNFVVKFNLTDGSLYSLKYNGQNIIEDGNGPKLDAFRCFVNNDNWVYSQWFENGLHNLMHKATTANVRKDANGNVVLFFTVESQAPNGAKIIGGTSSGKNKIEELTSRSFGENDFKFTTNQTWTVYKDGSIELEANISSNKPSLVLPRLGYRMLLPKKFNNMTYYGRGPVENYPDRKTGQFIEKYSTTVEKQVANFPKPQDMGNHEEVRWCALSDNMGDGALFVAKNHMSAAALPYSALDFLNAPHQYQLPQPKYTYLNLDMAVTGLGGNSCGQGGPLSCDRVFASNHSFGFIIRPITATSNIDKDANVTTSARTPLAVLRNRNGEVSVIGSDQSQIMLAIGKSKSKPYAGPFNFATGGTISVWYKDVPEDKVVVNFEKITEVRLTVVSTSSEEVGEGNASHICDGDASTYWHTMYSVTVANYPHWVEFDAGSQKLIKGFTYLPRPGGGNGTIKEYSLQLSSDGKTWSEPIVKGSFKAGANMSKVMLTTPTKARYIRFNAISEQHGHDYASGAEFTIIAE